MATARGSNSLLGAPDGTLRIILHSRFPYHPAHHRDVLHVHPALDQLQHLAQARRERLGGVGVAPDHQRFGGEVQASTVCPPDGGRQRVVQRIILADETQHPGIRQAAQIVRVDLAAQMISTA